MPLRLIHITNDVGTASGVGTFVRRLNYELCARGIDSSIVTSELGLGLRSPLILHLHGLWLGLHHSAAKWARAHGVPVIWSTHGMTAPWAMRHKWWKKFPAWWLYQKRDLKSAALIHCTTDQEAEWNHALGFPNTFIAPLGTDLGGMRSSKEVEVDSGVSSLRTLLFVGRLYPVKAIDRIIRAFAMTAHDGWQLKIVGPDQSGHLAELARLCDSLKISYSSTLQLQLLTPTPTTPAVIFTGPKFGDELSAEYAACDCAILASHTENFGATIADAMAHGKPVIAGTKTPWSVVSEQGCGWWVDNDPAVLSKAMSEMMSLTDAERAEMGEKGRQLVASRFTWSAVVDKVLTAYRSVCRSDATIG